MSRPLYRVKSAGGGQLDLAHQNQFLRDQMHKLQQELLNSKAECQKATDQLNCLIMLVKRAWAGDNSAALHVANIVGAAPPELQQEQLQTHPQSFSREEQNGHNSVNAKLKSRPLNNWAVLTVGLLNRAYKEEERVNKFQQGQHLQQRLLFLEEQELYHRDMRLREAQLKKSKPKTDLMQSPSSPAKEPAPSLRRRRNSQDGGNTFLTQTPGSRPTSGKKKAAGRQLYRNPEGQHKSDLTWADLVIEPSAQRQNTADSTQKQSLYRTGLDAGDNQYAEEYYDDIPYDDPSRYAMFGLFDTDSVPRLHQKRPPSGKQQKHSDSLRSRPKSAIYASQKAERPLKYETTRPVSASNKSRAGKSGKVNDAQNAKAKSQNKADHHESFDNGIDTERPDSEAGPYPTLEDYESVFSEEQVDADIGRPIKVNIKKPESVVKFEKEVASMKNMELEFQKTTLALQKKLGISPDGVVS